MHLHCVNMSDVQSEILQNRLVFLNSITHLLPLNPATKALRSRYLTKCRGLISQTDVDLPKEIIKESCPRCYVPYKDAPVLHRIEPAKRKNRFRRRLLQNIENANTRFQINYLKSLQSKNAVINHNFLVRICGVCGYNAKKVLQKPVVQTQRESFDTCAVPNKRKKRKKDRFSGLNVDAVLSVTPQRKVSQSIIKETPKQTQSTPKALLNKSQIRKNKVENKRKLKGLKSIFNESNKSSPANALKNFLNSL